MIEVKVVNISIDELRMLLREEIKAELQLLKIKQDDWLTLTEAETEMRFSKKKITNLIKAKKLDSTGTRQSTRISLKSINAYREELTN